MSEVKEVERLLKEIEEKLGLKAYDELKNYLFTIYRKLEDLEKSRNNWRNEYNELKNDN